MSIAYFPVQSLPDLDALDEDEILQGYRDGFADDPLPANHSRAYWHGWCNGQRDCNRSDTSTAARRLARLYVERGMLG